MSDSSPDSTIWWRINSRLEVKNVHLFGFHFSPRQLLLTLVALAAGSVISAPLGASLGRLAVAGLFALAGLMVSSKEVKMTPIELVILYRLTKYGASGKREPSFRPAPGEAHPKAGAREEGEVELLPVEDFTRPTPYNVSGRLRAEKRVKLSLFLDDELLDEQAVSPSSSQYWFVYLPKVEHIGTHDLTIRAEGVAEPLFRRTIAVYPRGKEKMMLEEKKG